jgi:hypothetical protein
MNIMPLVGFYWKHGSQIEAMFSGGSTPDGSHLLLDVASALAPVVKKHWPQLNADNLLDDGVATLRALLAPPPAVPTTQNIQDQQGAGST